MAATEEFFGAIALSNLKATRDGELSIQKGERMLVCGSVGGARGFWSAVRRGAEAGTGLVPKAHLRRCELQVAIACGDYTAELPEQLSISEGDQLSVVEVADDGWALVARLSNHDTAGLEPISGLVPQEALSLSRLATLLAPFEAEADVELPVCEGQQVWVLPDEAGSAGEGWVKAVSLDGRHGLLPETYVDFAETEVRPDGLDVGEAKEAMAAMRAEQEQLMQEKRASEADATEAREELEVLRESAGKEAGAMELVALDMKRRGLYASRSRFTYDIGEVYL